MTTIEIIGFEAQAETEVKIPLFQMSVSAGLPTPADSTVEKEIDLNELLIAHPAATIFARINGKELEPYGISDQDILIVDTALEPEDGKLILVDLSGNFTVKNYRLIEGEEYLESHDRQYLPLNIGELSYKPVGVITAIIHSL